MTIYGVVGNQRGWQTEFVIKKLKEIGITHKDTIISGGADGVDNMAQIYAKLTGCRMIIEYPNPDIPSPDRYFIRNDDIAKNCQVLIAFDKKSGRAGTKNTIAQAKKYGREVILFKEELS